MLDALITLLTIIFAGVVAGVLSSAISILLIKIFKQ